MKLAQPKRPYRQTVRAAAAEATGERIMDVFTACLRDRWFDEIPLEEIAREAGVTIQTVIRRFGSKEGLLEAVHERFGDEIRGRRRVAPGDVGRAIDCVIEDYEQVGDLIIRVLAQEDRYSPLRAVADAGRASHREWTAAVFAPWLETKEKQERRLAHDALVIATDLYIWKLVRRDMKRSPAELRQLMARMISAALDLPQDSISNPAQPELPHAVR